MATPGHGSVVPSYQLLGAGAYPKVSFDLLDAWPSKPKTRLQSKVDFCGISSLTQVHFADNAEQFACSLGLGFGSSTPKKSSNTLKEADWRANDTCPCGTKRKYDDCCGKYHVGVEKPPTAESTMRSRFSAYALGKVSIDVQVSFNCFSFKGECKCNTWSQVQYVIDTTHPENGAYSGPTFREDVFATSERMRFHHLNVLKVCTYHWHICTAVPSRPTFTSWSCASGYLSKACCREV